MKITIVTSVFNAGRGYQENIWSDVLNEMGHDITVITSNLTSHGQKHDNVELDFPIYRISSKELPHKIFIHKRNAVTDIIRKIQPDLILWIDSCSYFGYDIIHYKKHVDPSVKLVCFYGENSSMHPYTKPNKPLKEVIAVNGWKLLRGFIYRKVIPIASVNLHTVSETKDIHALLFSKKRYATFDERMHFMPLGFDETKFFYDSRIRNELRESLNIGDDEKLFVVSSRFTIFKINTALRKLLVRLSKFMEKHKKVKLLIIGILDDNPENEFLEEVKKLPASDRMIFKPLVTQTELNAYYNAGDVSFFQLASISSQQAMGSGCYIIYIGDGSMDAIHTPPVTGYGYQDSEEDFYKGIENYLENYSSDAERKKRVEINSFLEYRHTISKLLGILEKVN